MIENSKKTQDPRFLMFLNRVPKLSEDARKVAILCHALSNGTNCVRLDRNDLKAVGLYKAFRQKEALAELKEFNIILNNDDSTLNFLEGDICPGCIYEAGSRPCRQRRGLLFINRNPFTWTPPQKASYNPFLMDELLEKNQIDLPPISSASLNKKIGYRLQKK